MKKTTLESSIVIRQNLETSVKTLNEMLVDEKPMAEINKQIASIDETVKDLNGVILNEEFAVLRSAEKPMDAAIRKLVLPKVNVKAVSDKDTKAVHYEIVDSEKIIDLIAFEDFCGNKTIAHEVGWRYRAEHFARLLSARVTKDIGGDAKALLNDYKLSKKAAETVTQEPVPTSNTQLTKYLQNLVDMMLFSENEKGQNQYKVTSQDVAFMLYLAVRAAKAPKTATMPQGKTIVNLTTQIINRIVTNDTYASLYKKNDTKEVGIKVAA